MANKAQQIVLDLNAKGFNNSQIAKILGRDSSYISQIKAGKRSGEAYIEGLQAIQSGKKVPTIERRRTKTGKIARIKTSPHIKNVEGSTIAYTSSSPDGPQTMKVLRTIADNNGKIGLSVDLAKFKAYDMPKAAKGSTALWTHWYSAKSVLQKMQEQNLTFSQLIEQQISNREKVDEAKGVRKVTINVDYTPTTNRPIDTLFPHRHK